MWKILSYKVLDFITFAVVGRNHDFWRRERYFLNSVNPLSIVGVALDIQ
jgi:hypothetical protein